MRRSHGRLGAGRNRRTHARRNWSGSEEWPAPPIVGDDLATSWRVEIVEDETGTTIDSGEPAILSQEWWRRDKGGHLRCGFLRFRGCLGLMSGDSWRFRAGAHVVVWGGARRFWPISSAANAGGLFLPAVAGMFTKRRYPTVQSATTIRLLQPCSAALRPADRKAHQQREPQPPLYHTKGRTRASMVFWSIARATETLKCPSTT